MSRRGNCWDNAEHYNRRDFIRGAYIPPENYEQSRQFALCDFNIKTDAFAAGMVLYSFYTADRFYTYMDKPFDEYAEHYKHFYYKALEFRTQRQVILPTIMIEVAKTVCLPSKILWVSSL